MATTLNCKSTQWIVSEIESDDLTSYIGLQDPFSDAGRSIILARRKAIQR